MPPVRLCREVLGYGCNTGKTQPAARGAAALVPGKPPGAALAGAGVRLPDLGVGDHAAADPGGGGDPVFSAVHGGVPVGGGFGRLRRGAADEAVGGPGLLQPGPESAPGGADLEPALGRYLDRYGCPDGIFAFSDLLALDAACCLQGRGIRIPQDIRLIGFDDILSHIRLPFPLSSVSADKTLETSLAVDRLLACIRGEAPQQTLIRIPVHLELRESSL